MIGVYKGRVISTAKGKDGGDSSFEYLVIGDGLKSRSEVLRVIGDGVVADANKEVSLQLDHISGNRKADGKPFTMYKLVK